MASTIDELLVALRLDVDKQSFNNASSSFASVTQAARRMAGVLGVGLGMDKLTRQFAGTNAELGRFAKNAGVSAQFVSGLEFAFKQAGGSADDARGSIETMRKVWEDFTTGNYGRFEAAARFGFDSGDLLQSRDFGEMINNIASQVSKAKPELRASMLDALGIGNESARTLFSQGPQQIGQYMAVAKELAPVTDKMVDAAIKYDQEMGRLTQALKGITDQLSMEILPDLTDALGDATRFIRENNKLISEYLGKDQFEIGDEIGDTILGAVSDWAKDHGMSEEDAQNLREGGLSGYLQGRDTSYDQVNDYNFENWLNEMEAKRKKEEAGLLNDDTIGAWLNSQSSNDPIDDNVLRALAWQESRGQHRDENGRLTRSHAGALGAYQIKPSTGARPGYGIAPLRSNSEEDQKRFADEYLTVALKRYGSLDKAFASYNAGIGATDKAIRENGANWLSALPPETRAYVPSVKGKLAQMEGGRPQASVSVGQITVQGATDPMETARAVRREIAVMAEQAGADMNTGVV